MPGPDFATRLRKHREAAHLSRVDVSFALRDYPKAMWASHEKLRRMERGEVAEDSLDPMLIAVLADLYHCKVSDLSPSAVKGAERFRDLLDAGIRWNTQSAGSRNALVA